MPFLITPRLPAAGRKAPVPATKLARRCRQSGMCWVWRRNACGNLLTSN